MIVSFLQILQESVTKLLPGGDREIQVLPPVATAALLGTVGLKGLIGLACSRCTSSTTGPRRAWRT